ncbi:hypothetical protein PENTCL1PPCAC_4266 [Pristionchus entomophagus]|uniref:Uncharacterized protein n=1 Tax=Pristionchus entomophagus TaxID=358040 RepID=A0AAV5SFH2_9BILA|nr:hypothetical protein PENTCL1PPCAC_4266 [Pristionchus entomophagus]
MRQFDFFTNTTLTLGYTFEYFPYNFFGKYDNVLKGIYHEPWNIISEKTGVTFRNQYENYFVILDEIQNGTILTTLDAVTKVTESIKTAYSYSVPFYFSTMFAVFEPAAWAILIAMAFVACLIDKARRHYRRGHRELSRVPTMIYLLAILIIASIHSAGFKGNTVITSLTATSYTTLVTDLRSGRRQLVLQPTLTNPLANGIDYMLSNQSRPVLSMSPTDYRLEQVCTNQDYVTRIFTLDLVVLQSVELPCILDRIFIDDSPMGQNATFNEEFDINLPFMLIFKREAVTKRSVDMLNQILLRLFREEQISQLWTPRFIRTFATKSEETTKGRGLEYKPIR